VDSIKEVIVVLISLTNTAAAARIIYCISKIYSNEDEAKTYVRRIKHILWFLVFANSVWVIKALIEGYYK